MAYIGRAGLASVVADDTYPHLASAFVHVGEDAMKIDLGQNAPKPFIDVALPGILDGCLTRSQLGRVPCKLGFEKSVGKVKEPLSGDLILQSDAHRRLITLPDQFGS